MLWELALRQAGQPQRAQWVLWEMTRRFPDHLPCRVELARLLAESSIADDQAQAQRLLQQVLALDPNHLHAHSTLAQLAIRRRDWDQALQHAQNGLSVEPSNQSSAMLQATAYARRAGPDDLQTAIDQLRRFVNRYSGDLKAEDYLRKLLQRQQGLSQGQRRNFEEDESTDTTDTPSRPETDPAWAAFAESTRTWVAAAAAPEAPNTTPAGLTDRMLPLPQALQQAVAQQQWHADVLSQYDSAALQEFPLETRLWHYLQTFKTCADISTREPAKQAVAQWLDAEARAPTQDSKSWLPYLQQQWAALLPATEDALASGAVWLNDLLDRYRPLPAPLLV